MLNFKKTIIMFKLNKINIVLLGLDKIASRGTAEKQG